MIGMFSQEEDGVTIWGPARGRSPLPQQVASNFIVNMIFQDITYDYDKE